MLFQSALTNKILELLIYLFLKVYTFAGCSFNTFNNDSCTELLHIKWYKHGLQLAIEQLWWQMRVKCFNQGHLIERMWGEVSKIIFTISKVTNMSLQKACSFFFFQRLECRHLEGLLYRQIFLSAYVHHFTFSKYFLFFLSIFLYSMFWAVMFIMRLVDNWESSWNFLFFFLIFSLYRKSGLYIEKHWLREQTDGWF